MNAAAWSEAAYQAVIEVAGARAGLDFAPNRRRIVEDTLERLRVAKGLSSPEALLTELQSSEVFAAEVLSALTVGETYFFREPSQFDLLRTHVIAERLTAAGPQSRLHLWSVGCATGEEPYSLAILMDQEGLADRAAIFASDLDATALDRARGARFRPWSFRNLPAQVRDRYFQAEGREFRLDASIRSRVTFFPYNLAVEGASRLWLGLWGLDVVMCRNVLIYMHEPAQRLAYQRLAHALAPGGWLLLGASDPPPPPDLPLALVATASGQVYRRTEPASPEAPSDDPLAARPTRRAAAEPSRASSLVAPAPPPSAPEPSPGGAADVLHLAEVEGAEVALAYAAQRVEADPFDAELRYTQALLHLESGHPERAAVALRQVLYLDRTLPSAHFLFALVHDKLADEEAARRCLANAELLVAGHDDRVELRLGRGETVGALRVAIRRARARLGYVRGAGE